MKNSCKKKHYIASLSYSSHSYQWNEYYNVGQIGLKSNVGVDYKKNKHTRCNTYLVSTIESLNGRYRHTCQKS